MARTKNLDHFYSLLDQYRNIAFPDSLQQESSPIATLELLGTINYVKSVSDQQIIDIIVSGCKSIGHETTLSRYFYQFMYKQFSKQIRVTNFRSSQFDMTIHYLLEGLDNTNDLSDDHKVDLLRALSSLVFETANHTQRSANRLSTLLLRFANPSYTSLQVRRMAINCIGNACANAGNTKLQAFFQEFYACLLSNLCKVDRTSEGTLLVRAPTTDILNDDASIRKIASSTLRALQFLLSQDKSLVTNPLCDMIDIIHTFIFMQVNVHTYSIQSTKMPTRRNKLLTTPLTKPSFSWRTTTASLSYQMKSMSLVTSSESELSDSPTLTPELSPRRQRDYTKIRINALLCLSAIATTSPKVLYSHWSKFLPDTFSIFLSNNTNSEGKLLPFLRTDNQPYSLFTILLYDPIIHVRSAVCHALIAMLNGSKNYLSLALER
ncbi:uncharacterized protein BX663DRAFT_568739 [Cokeromyces recurvatus]|uniref:uncharacterized protein n=1 Tax=Cokeromyces recurvatus TaxID=90255 RepID=UPI0022200B04|nr:uncharacterized protein BX663DRAFT_568739 [Cokeromyces recurvatus]KAI7902842.1 hypothetical protein BX663DRAFT_568739 [Cokeromyces recurvatus]